MSTLLVVKDPFTGKELGKVPFASREEITKKLAAGKIAFEKWRPSPSWRRAELLTHAADKLEKQKSEFIKLISEEAGKPIIYSTVEVNRALGVLRWAAAEALRFSGEILRLDTTQGSRSGFGIHQKFPRGLILGITPFNFPLNLALHKIAPAIACGCSILIKPSPSTPLTALKLAELFSEEADLVQVVIADDAATEEITKASEVAMISFTGSAPVGWLIRKQAPEKPAALELGGNAWVIVLEDTPESTYPQIAKRIANAAYGYAGQSCISVQNAAIEESVWPKFQEILRQATLQTPFGDPSDSKVISGPVIRAEAVSRIESALGKTPKDAERVTSTSRIGSGSNLVSPTLILMNGSQSDSLVQEEIFAPVMTARKFSNIDAVITQINSSRYGLQAGVFTQNFSAIDRLYRELQVGGLIVNDVPTTRYDHQPYGGVKDSGFGREGIRYAMEEMCESKFLALSSEIPK